MTCFRCRWCKYWTAFRFFSLNCSWTQRRCLEWWSGLSVTAIKRPIADTGVTIKRRYQLWDNICFQLQYRPRLKISAWLVVETRWKSGNFGWHQSQVINKINRDIKQDICDLFRCCFIRIIAPNGILTPAKGRGSRCIVGGGTRGRFAYKLVNLFTKVTHFCRSDSLQLLMTHRQWVARQPNSR